MGDKRSNGGCKLGSFGGGGGGPGVSLVLLASSSCELEFSFVLFVAFSGLCMDWPVGGVAGDGGVLDDMLTVKNQENWNKSGGNDSIKCTLPMDCEQ
jgi:hypothetical protein